MRGLPAVLTLALLLGAASSIEAQPKRPPTTAAKGKPAPRPARGKAPPARGNGQPTEAARRAVAGSPVAVGAADEAPELKALRDAEREIFPKNPPLGASPRLDPAPGLQASLPEVHASGLPPAPASLDTPTDLKDRPAPWMQSLKMPDLPVRWDERVVRYLQFFRDDPRGRSMAAVGWKRAGRYREVIRAALRAEKLPESLLWVSMVESGFEPRIRSHAGAAGLWQFMPDGARLYGLRADRWMDERQDPVRSSQAAARYLSDLHQRFGTWELALAAYNMGFGGLLSAIRKYNTNDFWELTRFEAGVPWETALYVPKIIALAVVAENPQVFGLDTLTADAPMAFDTIQAPPSLSLEAVARAAGAPTVDLFALNPQLPARRTPPAPLSDTTVRVPVGLAPAARQRLADEAAREPRHTLTTLRFGQTLASLAQELGVSRSSLADLNGVSFDDNLAPGDSILVPASARLSPAAPAERPVVVAPRSPSALPGKQRVFYRVVAGDSLAAVAAAFRAEADDLKSWNHLDPAARLQPGTTLQVFVPPDHDLSGVVAVRESEAQVLVAGTDEFFTWFEAQKGRRRVTITVGQGETWQTLSRKYGISLGLLERINRRGHGEPLKPGETVIVYTKKPGEPAKSAVAAADEPS